MNRSPTRPSDAARADAQLQALSDDALLDFLAAARRGFARAEAESGGASGYAGALAALELEAMRRRLGIASPHERPTTATVLRRLSEVAVTLEGGEWERLLAELDLPGLWAVYRHVQNEVSVAERVPALAQVCLAVDRIVYGETVAQARQLKYVLRPETDEARLAAVTRALEVTFGRIFDRIAEEGTES